MLNLWLIYVDRPVCWVMNYLQLFVGLIVDCVAIALLVFAIYYPRYRRPELLVAFIALNLGVFSAVTLLASSDGGLALGFGLFGILSIVRLRSSTISQSEIGYCFVALTLGLINGLGYTHLPVAVGLDAVLLAAMFGLDRLTSTLERRRFSDDVSHRTVTLDVVHGDEEALRADIERRLGAEVLGCEVTAIDYLTDVTICEVRCRKSQRTRTPAGGPR